MAKRKRIGAQSEPSTREAKISKGSVPNERRRQQTDAKDDVVRLEIPLEDKVIVCDRKGPEGNPELIFTHGAGGSIDSPAIQDFLCGFGTYACFQGNMNMKSRVKSFHTVLTHMGTHKALGGRSMGARAAVVATLEMETEKPEALVLVSYPLTGGKGGQDRQPEQREQTLLDLPENVDVLFAIGSDDNQCDLELLRDVTERMKATTWLLELKDADHGTNLKHKPAVQPMRAEVGLVAAEWLNFRDRAKRYRTIQWNQDEGCIATQGWQSTSGSHEHETA